MNNQLYKSHFGTDDKKIVVGHFLQTLVDTNRGHEFFVDWQKVRQRIDENKIELNILNSLIGSKTFNADLTKILENYPETLPIIPILIAVRDLRFRVIADFLCETTDYIDYDFNRRKLTSTDIHKYILFFEKTGLKDFFENLAAKSIQDYVAGVEVGMDTNARKNRSGNAMEFLLKPIIREISSKITKISKVLTQKKFNVLGDYGISVPADLSDRKADFILLMANNSVINIEVNFFSGTGSKPQEIVDSYINRQNELKQYGYNFIWITDGQGWRDQEHQISKGFEKIDYLMNLHLSRSGFLEKVLREI